MSRGVASEMILHMKKKMVRRRALFIKSATAFAVLAVASAPPMLFYACSVYFSSVTDSKIDSPVFGEGLMVHLCLIIF